MTAAIGLLYQDNGPRLCNAYLQSDQDITGTALMWVAVAAAFILIGQLAATGSQRSEL